MKMNISFISTVKENKLRMIFFNRFRTSLFLENTKRSYIKEIRMALYMSCGYSLINLRNAGFWTSGEESLPFLASIESTGVLCSWVFASIMQMFASRKGELKHGELLLGVSSDKTRLLYCFAKVMPCSVMCWVGFSPVSEQRDCFQ